MKKNVLQAGILVSSVCLMGCQVPGVGESESKNADVEEIVWTLPSVDMGLEENIDLLNAKLSEDGYPYALKLQYLESENYNQALSRTLKKGKTDIAFLGYETIEYAELTTADIMREGNVEDLTDYLQGDAGAALYQAYPEELWEAAKVDGRQYSIPNENLTYSMMYVAFNRAYFSEEDVEYFDGSVESLVDLVKEKVPDTVKYPLLWNTDISIVANWCGYGNRYYALSSLDTGEFYNPLELEDIRQFILQIHDAAEEGILCELSGSDDLKSIEANRDFGVVACTFSNGMINESTEDVILVRAPFSLETVQGAATGVCANSEKKEDALQLLTMLHTNAEYANLLLWGEEGTDYRLEDGYAVSMESAESSPYMFDFGIYDVIYHSKTDNFSMNTKEEKKAFLDSAAYKENVLIGFVPELRSEGIAYGDLHDLLEFCYMPSVTEYSAGGMDMSLSKSQYDTTEEWLEIAENYYDRLGGNLAVEDLNTQAEQFLETR